MLCNCGGLWLTLIVPSVSFSHCVSVGSRSTADAEKGKEALSPCIFLCENPQWTEAASRVSRGLFLQGRIQQSELKWKPECFSAAVGGGNYYSMRKMHVCVQSEACCQYRKWDVLDFTPAIFIWSLFLETQSFHYRGPLGWVGALRVQSGNIWGIWAWVLHKMLENAPGRPQNRSEVN